MYSFREVDPSVLDEKKVKKTKEVSENSDNLTIEGICDPCYVSTTTTNATETNHLVNAPVVYKIEEGYYSTRKPEVDHNYIRNQKAKADAGKPKLSLVPPQIIFDIAAVRDFGNSKYGDSENWKTVEVERYRDAAFRHLLRYIQDPNGVDEESGLSHLAHLACNVAFLCELERERR